MHFGVRFTGTLMPAVAYAFFVLDQHATDTRIGLVVYSPCSASRNACAIH